MKICATRRILLLFAVLSACQPSIEEEDKVTDEPQRYAAAICTAVSECGCYPHLETGCAAEVEARFVALVDAGMEFDKDCFDAVVTEERLEAGCGSMVDLDETDGGDRWHCTVLRGDKAVGDPCTNRIYDLVPFWVNECGEGLICYDGACAREGTTGPVRVLGAECPAGWPASCHNGLLCGPDGTCQEPPGPDEACASPFDCTPELFCAGWGAAGQGSCAPTLALGAACDPRDWFACGAADASGEGVPWCDPTSRVCVIEPPAICTALDFPAARDG